MNTELATVLQNGVLVKATSAEEIAKLEWTAHPKFKGVMMKNILTSKDTDGKVSTHLVSIDPLCEIGTHIHEKELELHEIIGGDGSVETDEGTISYKPGTLTFFEARKKHRVIAGTEGLFLLAKFIPALL